MVLDYGGTGFPCVITTTIGWGIGITAHFLGVFIIGPQSEKIKEKLEEKEYNTLKEKNRLGNLVSFL